MKRNGPRTLGYANGKEKARRLKIICDLYPTDMPLKLIGLRLGICGTTVQKIAKEAGLPPRVMRGSE